MPQTNGVPGWIVFTFENKKPVCLWITARECLVLPCIVDPRICCDTILRVERLNPKLYAIADIWLYNGNCIAACSTFEQRFHWLKDLLRISHSHVQGKIQLLHKSDLPPNTSMRGNEVYVNVPGSPGYFVERVEEGELLTILRTETPDVYRIQSREGYIRVPDLKTSVYLRSKGHPFSMRCIPHNEESWSIIEKIPDL